MYCILRYIYKHLNIFFLFFQKLEFTVSDVSPVSPATANPSLSPEELFKQMEQLLLEDMASDEQIFDWIEVRLIPHSQTSLV